MSPADIAAGAAPQRLFLDISTLLRWTGPPVGILRMEAELARYALAHGIGLVFFDPGRNQYREVLAGPARDVLAGELVVDTSHVRDPRPERRALLSRAAHAAAQELYPLRRPRRLAIMAIELLRLRLPSGRIRDAVEKVQTALFSERYRKLLLDKRGRRRAIRPLGRVLGDPVALGPDCVIVSAGADWNTRAPAVLAALKAQYGHRTVRGCHDLIPVKFPQYFLPADVAAYTAYMRAAVQSVDRFICISECTARDLAEFATQQGVEHLDIAAEPLGADPVPVRTDGKLPDDLVRGKYALFVSTIEPRKNHAMLHRAWLRLLERGIPQAAGFKLVLVGRVGWNMDALLREWREDPRLAGNLLHLQGLSDAALAALYGGAAFCVYPSLYEGFGLPVLEALAHGRAVIGSDRGALPEVMQDFGPMLDPDDEQGWTETMAQWITQPEIVAGYEARLAHFRPTTWEEAARRYFSRAAAPFAA
ncbi:MAG TPA: glycosyltransferase [Xanthobacteraceae bacterium]